MDENKEQIGMHSSEKENILICCVCGEPHESSRTHSIEIKGTKKYICRECADTVHGLI